MKYEECTEAIRQYLSDGVKAGVDIHHMIREIYGPTWFWGATMSLVGGLMARKEIFSPRLGYFQLCD